MIGNIEMISQLTSKIVDVNNDGVLNSR